MCAGVEFLPQFSLPYFVRQNLELTDWVRLVRQMTVEIHLSLSSQSGFTDVQCYAWLFMGAEEINTTPPDGAASILHLSQPLEVPHFFNKVL